MTKGEAIDAAVDNYLDNEDNGERPDEAQCIVDAIYSLAYDLDISNGKAARILKADGRIDADIADWDEAWSIIHNG